MSISPKLLKNASKIMLSEKVGLIDYKEISQKLLINSMIEQSA